MRAANTKALAIRTELNAKGGIAETQVALAVLARSLLAQAKPADARAVMDRAAPLASKSEDRTVRLTVGITAARVRAALGETERAMKELQTILAEAERTGFVNLQFEARLALGEIELRSGKSNAGIARLQLLEKEAAAKGFNLLARKASRALRARSRPGPS